MNRRSADALAAWLARNQPALFRALAQRAGVANLAGFLDVFKSVGAVAGNVVKGVGSFLASSDGLKTVTELGSAYMQTRAQASALQLQIEQARAAQPLLPISATPGSVPSVIGPDGRAYPLTPEIAARLAGGTPWAQYLPIAVIGGAVVLVLLLRR